MDWMARARLCVSSSAAKIERSEFLGAAPYERTATRRDYANGFKPKTILNPWSLNLKPFLLAIGYEFSVWRRG
jgi:hypothetical protein